MRFHRAILAAFILGLLTYYARPQSYAPPFEPCPYVTGGWSQSWTGFKISSALYDSYSALLYVIFGGTTASAYSGVPYSIVQGFSRTNNPDTYWSTSVNPQYHSLLLAQTNNCPLLFENGAYIWTK